ncbi:MAG: epoxyqueuosine reductase QueH [Nitrospinota bacterium]|mgnify:FL=1
MPKPKLILHICCAPCSPYAIDLLKRDFELTAYFYDPNIHPEEEYQFRLEEMRRFSHQIGLNFIAAEYDHDRWFKLTEGHENDREGGNRCEICFRMRLEETVIFAKRNGFKYFTTVLTTSPHKSAVVINKIGIELAEQYGLNFYAADFKKKDGFKVSVQRSKEYGLKRQNYCGCMFSQRGQRHDTHPLTVVQAPH